MGPINKRHLYRIIDANFNRAKEGLRVCEDVCRFILNEAEAVKRYKTLRHQLTRLVGQLDIVKVIQARDIDSDVGKGTHLLESKRKGAGDIFYANSQRIKESLRVLEEFAKLSHKKIARNLKAMRYHVYAIEKKVIKRL